ncbi:unnamed protein product [Polarella glacialis]|uniref:Uncharacterized protein n=1 Tax=Polarella glacialis TaxID=89957 RepID=A0A813G3G8_POLGL|nr:unnamed protein product [Polarella glacialis]CAE8639463.1 unnamed protein product [Polarella glacialis]
MAVAAVAAVAFSPSGRPASTFQALGTEFSAPCSRAVEWPTGSRGLSAGVPAVPTCRLAAILASAGIAAAALERRRQRLPARRVSRRVQGESGGGNELPSDETLRQSLNSRLPPELRFGREAAFNAEATLRRADERIAELGIDLEKADRELKELARILPQLPVDGPPIALCCLGGEAGFCRGSVEQQALAAALRARLLPRPEAILRWLDLEEVPKLATEDLSSQLGPECAALAIWASRQSPSEDRVAISGLAALLQKLPESVRRIVLISDSAGGALERFITAAVRERSPNASPLRSCILRADLCSDGESLSAVREIPAKVLAKLPATVRDAAWGLRSTLVGSSASTLVGGILQSLQFGGAGFLDGTSSPSTSATTPEAVAAVLEFALRRGVDVPEVTVTGGAEEADWDEVMLPLVGPELWRLPVEDANRARSWLRGWVEFNFCRGASQEAVAKKAGLRTPVEVRMTLHGACFKFMPSSSGRTPGAGFDGLSDGGLEILVDGEVDGSPGRIRVRRCAYGWRTQPRESSERAILSKLRRDWETSQSFQS